MSESRMFRLTRSELVQSLTDLLGATVMSDSQIQTQILTLPDDVIHASVTEVAPSPADIQASTIFQIASRVGDLVSADTSVRNQIFGSCSGTSPVPDSCAQTFIQNFGSKVYMRPLDPTESSGLLAQFKATGGVDGLNRVLIRLLMSPSLVFHIELGASVQGTRIRLTDYEVAARLSYRIAGTLPDAQLIQAAASGQLKDLANVRAQAQRLLGATSSAKAKVTDFFRFYTQNEQIQQPYAPAGQLLGINTVGLQNEMMQETTDFVNNVVWNRKGKFSDLLTSTEVFPRSDGMAKILDTTKAVGNTPSQTSKAHAGLLLRPALLSTSTDLTLPYHRAVLIRRGYLCENLGMPDPAALQNRQGQLGDLSSLSNRDRLTALTNAPACVGCHSFLNPVAFVLEGYDQLGALRTVETDFDSSGKVSTTHPIDTRVNSTRLFDLSGREVASLADAMGLVQAVASGSSMPSCFAQRVFEYQRARVSVPDDGCALSEVEDTAQATGTIQDAVINGVVNEDIFWKANGT